MMPALGPGRTMVSSTPRAGYRIAASKSLQACSQRRQASASWTGGYHHVDGAIPEHRPAAKR